MPDPVQGASQAEDAAVQRPTRLDPPPNENEPEPGDPAAIDQAADPPGPVATVTDTPFESGGQAPQATRAAPNLAIFVPGTRRWFATFAFGPAIWIRSPRTRNEVFLLTFEESVGAHIRLASSGPGVAAVLQQSVTFGYQDYAFGGRFMWDVQPSRRRGFYLSPSVLAAYNLRRVGYSFGYSYYDGYGYDDEPSDAEESVHHLEAQIAVDLKFLLGDRLLLTARPITVEIISDFSAIQVRWQVLFGIGVTL